jgi:hypothetical protein
MADWQSSIGGSRPVPIGSRSIGVSLRPAIPRRVAPQQSPPPLHRSPTIVAHPRGHQIALLNLTVSACPVVVTGVSFLLCTAGVISILRRHYAKPKKLRAKVG